MRRSEKDLVNKLLTSNRIFTRKGLTQQGDEAGKLPIFSYVCMLIVFPRELNVVKNKSERDFVFFEGYWV